MILETCVTSRLTQNILPLGRSPYTVYPEFSFCCCGNVWMKAIAKVAKKKTTCVEDGHLEVNDCTESNEAFQKQPPLL